MKRTQVSPQVVVSQFDDGVTTIAVSIRNQHVFHATRRWIDEAWRFGSLNTPDEMTQPELKQLADALNDVATLTTRGLLG